jgi:hypothetical protein
MSVYVRLKNVFDRPLPEPDVTGSELDVGGGFEDAIVTFTVTESVFDGSATLVAVTVSVPAFAGALYAPELLIVPSTAFHVTALFVVVPATLAANGRVPEVIDDAVAGDTDTEVMVPVAATGLAATAAEFALVPLLFTAATAK